MRAIGVVAEYDPFHLGHRRHLEETRRLLGGELGVVCVMSGNFVQRGTCAQTDKWTRTRLALNGGVDLVVELPTLWAAASARDFARGAVSLLTGSGVVDYLSFGSECGDLTALQTVAECLGGAEYDRAVRGALGGGAGFAACRQQAVEALLGGKYASLLAQANNNLGVEYLLALKEGGSALRPVTVRRTGQGHDGTPPAAGEEGEQLRCGASLRAMAAAGEWSALERYVPAGTLPILRAGGTADMARVERAMVAALRRMDEADFAALPDSGGGEGLPRRLADAAARSMSMGDFYRRAKTRRYSHARLRRLALWAFLGLRAADRPAKPPYLRVLGFGERGRALLREMEARSALPVVVKTAHIRTLDAAARRVMELEARCTDLYGLCMETVPPAGREWTTSPVILPPDGTRGKGAEKEDAAMVPYPCL